MKTRIVEYGIIAGNDIDIVDIDVNRVINGEGMQPFGNLVYYDGVYMQPVVKYEEETPKMRDILADQAAYNKRVVDHAENNPNGVRQPNERVYQGIDPAKYGEDKSVCSFCGDDIDGVANDICPYPTNHIQF
jgi:hypothetical protein